MCRRAAVCLYCAYCAYSQHNLAVDGGFEEPDVVAVDRNGGFECETNAHLPPRPDHHGEAAPLRLGRALVSSDPDGDGQPAWREHDSEDSPRAPEYVQQQAEFERHTKYALYACTPRTLVTAQLKAWKVERHR